MTASAGSLFTSFFLIGLSSIGGGYAVIPLISQKAVIAEGWITAREFTDIITISQMTPGPLAVNTSTFVGLRIDGIAGAAAATLGCVLPGLLISLLLYGFFARFRSSAPAQNALDTLRAVSAGLIASAAATILSLVFLPAQGGTPAAAPAAEILQIHDSPAQYAAALLAEAAFPAAVLLVSLWLLHTRRAGPMLIMACSGLAGAAAYLLF